MKKLLTISLLAALIAAGTTISAQPQRDEYLGLPGDNLNLYAVMKLFQESETLEGFERILNDENSRINNLDLNGDNLTDYIKVIDYVDGNIHTIVLQVALDRNQNQDVAVFTVQRFGNGTVQIQLTGDEALYGRNYIIEPIYDDNRAEIPNPGYAVRPVGENVTVVRTTYVEIAAWPLIRFIYLPGYAVWRSSWYWGYYPEYWHPWHPFFWHYYYGYHYNMHPYYFGHYRHWDHHRYNRWDDTYFRERRIVSSDVSMRIRSGNFRTTYSHPDQRKEGEAFYSKMHPDQNNRRSEASPSSDQNTNLPRRSNSTMTDRSRTNPSSGQNAGTSRRAPTVPTEKARTDRPSEQNAGTSSRRSSSVNERAASKPESGQRAESGRTSRQSSPNASSSNRRSSGNNRASVKEKKSSNAREPENNKSPRRK